MTPLALAKPGTGPYAVEFTPRASHALMRTPLPVSSQLQHGLNEIAEVAGAIAFVIADGAGSTLHLEIAGHQVSYVINDVRRTLTVVSMVPATEGVAATATE